MKRRLITQMRNEWRSNIWMVLELAIVGLVLWASFSVFVYLISQRMIHYGYEVDNIYHAWITPVPRTSVSFQEYPDSLHSYQTDLELIRARIAGNPYVEMAAIGQNSMPYNYNYSGNRVNYNVGDSMYVYQGNMRWVTPDLIRILRLEGLNGETTEQLASVIEKGDLIVSNFDKGFFDGNPGPEEFAGRDVFLDNDSSQVMHVGATAYGIHRNDYEDLFGGVIYRPITSGWGNEMVIRVKPGMGKAFIESIKASDLEHGNVFLHSLMSIDQMRDTAHRDIMITVRNLAMCAGFLLVIVFLGFLGTFWFRIQQRTSEIAIRMTNGATRAEIFNRLLSEGFILLGLGCLIFLPIMFAMTHFSVPNWGVPLTGNTAMWALAAAIFMLAVMVVAGIWMPARKAMSINPAEALKDQ